ncbi:mannosyltransferase [Streptomyces sp. 846.5]|nr:glycosyltransferase family 39 protein [Streptomyces sp. 846.5]TDT95823.1 mannosyltransferase [Streptomyces sp. 846.5]
MSPVPTYSSLRLRPSEQPGDGGRGPEWTPGTLALLLPPVVLALTLGLWGIGRDRSLWGDEAVSLEVAHRSTAQIWELAHHVDAVHTLYYLLLHGMFQLHDGGPALLRLPSVLGTAAAAAGVALIGRRLAGPSAGLAAGLVLPVFPAVQQYAQEGRSYALVMAAVVGSGLLLLRAVERPDPGRWCGYAAAALATCLLQEYAALAVAAHAVTLGLARVERRVWVGWCSAVAAVLAGLAPLAVVGAEQAKQVAWITAPTTNTVLFAAGMCLLGALCALVPQRPAGAVSLRGFALPLLLLPQGLLLAVSLVHPVYLDRYVLFEYAGLALLLGSALDAFGRRLPRVGPRALLAVPLALLLLLPVETQLRTPMSRSDDLQGTARAVAVLAEPGDGVLFLPSSRRQSELAFPQDYAGLTDLALSAPVAGSATLGGVELTPQQIGARMAGFARIITVRTQGKGPSPTAASRDKAKQAALTAGFQKCTGLEVRGVEVSLYARPGACPSR